MKYDYPITQIEIQPLADGVQVFVERQQTFTDPDTGEVYRLNRWRTPIPAEAVNDLETFLSRDGASLSDSDRDFLSKKLSTALRVLGIHKTQTDLDPTGTTPHQPSKSPGRGQSQGKGQGQNKV